jgi:phenylalanyl-tRNA synthetase beta chain
MNASYEWLRAFVPHALTPAELRDLLTARCATVEELVALREDIASVVIGRVVEAARHPNSDHLWVTKVDAGTGALLDVVCGAPNVEAGKLYPFAAVGTTLPGGLTLEKRKIRGETSNGMLCSARELGLGQDHDGVLQLDVDAAPGTRFIDAVAVGDTRLVVDVLPNRPDLLSHLGLAREIAAATGAELRPRGDAAEHGVAPISAEAVHAGLDGTVAGTRVTIADVEGCPRYLGAVVRGVRVGPSPQWLVDRLAAVGARSINNVVDATNYMLHGYGQPMHAFDVTRLAGNAVVVRRATAGETIITLDGVARTLTPEMTVIADAERAQAVAGVIGGRDSEVTEATTDVFLECATFDARRVRATRRALGVSTDASYRFERGVSPESPAAWLAEAIGLLIAVAGGTLDGAPVDLHAALPARRAVELRAARVARVLGATLSAEACATLLASVGFEVLGQGGVGEQGTLSVGVPAWRNDVEREIDLIEEVARLHGFDRLPDELRPFRPTLLRDDPLAVTTRRVREALVAGGLLEARPMPFVKGAESGFVRLANPLAEHEAYLRTSVLDSLARRAEYNLSHMQGNVRLFEIGATFAPAAGALPLEEMRVGALLMGERRPPHFTEAKPPVFDQWDAKALAEVVCDAAYGAGRCALRPPADDAGGRLWDLVLLGADAEEVVGHVSGVPLDAPVWAAPAFGVELRLATLSAEPVAPAGERAATTEQAPGARGRVRYVPLPTTPPAEFDLALLVPDGVSAEQVETVMRAAGGELLERVALFDEFRGGDVPAGHRSLAWHLTLRDPARTLRDKEVDGRRTKLLRALDGELGVRPRTA